MDKLDMIVSFLVVIVAAWAVMAYLGHPRRPESRKHPRFTNVRDARARAIYGADEEYAEEVPVSKLQA